VALAALAVCGAGEAAAAAGAGSAEELRPLNLRVAGGEERWHADDDFRLDWDGSAGAGLAVTAVDYLLRDAGGAVVQSPTRIAREVRDIDHIHVPPTPGAYTAELWLEGPLGMQGPPVSAELRFDDAAPGPVQASGPPGWIAAGVPALIRIAHPPEPLPLSGLRGYAVAVDRGAGAAPCASPDRCSEAETDLGGGIDDDSLSIGMLPEGTTSVRVVAVSGSGVSSAGVGSTEVRVDATTPEVSLSGAPQGWAAGPLRLTATATDALSGMLPAGPAGPFTAIAVDGGPARSAAGDSATLTVTGEGTHAVAFYARDAAGNVNDGQAGSPPPSVALVGIDETPPAVLFSRWSDPSEPERIEVEVSDSLSGPDAARGSIALRPAGSGAQFERIPTAVVAGGLSARWDSDSYPPGSYEFRATGYDAAGNAGRTDRRLDGDRLVLTNPIKVEAELEFGFAGRRRASGERTVPYGRAASVGGRLSTATGAPLAGMAVDVVESFDPGAGVPTRTTTVETAADGSFRARLGAGPCRRVEARFAGNRTLTRAAAGPLRLAVLSAPRLRASASKAIVGGAPVVFRGRLEHRGATIPPSGRPIQLQFRLPGSRWSEFRTIQTDAGGHFRYPYAFTDDDSRGVRFEFRAYAPAQPGWPYKAGASRPVAVTGR
jgi:hypothetical protein